MFRFSREFECVLKKLKNRLIITKGLFDHLVICYDVCFRYGFSCEVEKGI